MPTVSGEKYFWIVESIMFKIRRRMEWFSINGNFFFKILTYSFHMLYNINNIIYACMKNILFIVVKGELL